MLKSNKIESLLLERCCCSALHCTNVSCNDYISNILRFASHCSEIKLKAVIMPIINLFSQRVLRELHWLCIHIIIYPKSIQYTDYLYNNIPKEYTIHTIH